MSRDPAFLLVVLFFTFAHYVYRGRAATVLLRRDDSPAVDVHVILVRGYVHSSVDVGDIELVGNDGTGERNRERPAGDEPEDTVGRSIVPGERFADARRGAADDDALRYFSFLARSTRLDTVCSMPSPALTT